MLGIILAGGKSSRMGCDKAELVYRGRSLLQHARELLRQCGCEPVLISRNQNGFVRDIVVDRGPLGGLHACLQQAGVAGGGLVIPVDMPLLTVSLLNTLAQAGLNRHQCCYYTDADHRDCWLPLYFPDARQLAAQVWDCLQHERSSMKDLLTAAGAAAIPCADGGALLNANTVSEWQSMQSINGG